MQTMRCNKIQFTTHLLTASTFLNHKVIINVSLLYVMRTAAGLNDPSVPK